MCIFRLPERGKHLSHVVICVLSSPHSPSPELNSWKEIAAFLGISVRTAQLWEAQRGLPVRRLPGGRSRVSATVAALEAWRNAQWTVAPPPEPMRPPGLKVFFRPALGLMALVLSAAALWFATRRPAQPAALDLHGNVLTVLDRKGGELWKKRFEANLLPLTSPGARRSWIGDVDGDRRTELLFAPVISNSGPAPLICYSEDGVEKWRFNPGRGVSTRSKTFSNEYRVESFAVFLLGGRNVIAVASSHRDRHPSQVALLSSRGALQREYWHSGNLISLEAAELDGDGVPELYAGGASISHRTATLVRLDPLTMGGASVEPEESGYQLLGFPPAEECARLLFPRTCVNRVLEQHNTVVEVLPEPGRLTAAVREATHSKAKIRVFYHFTPDLSLQSVVPGDGFRSLHRAMEERGQLDHPLSDKDEAALRDVRRIP